MTTSSPDINPKIPRIPCPNCSRLMAAIYAGHHVCAYCGHRQPIPSEVYRAYNETPEEKHPPESACSPEDPGVYGL